MSSDDRHSASLRMDNIDGVESHSGTDNEPELLI